LVSDQLVTAGALCFSVALAELAASVRVLSDGFFAFRGCFFAFRGVRTCALSVSIAGAVTASGLAVVRVTLFVGVLNAFVAGAAAAASVCEGRSNECECADGRERKDESNHGNL
jgi:hypothetical protein